MNLRIEKQYVNKYPFKGGIAESHYDIFLKIHICKYIKADY